MPFLRCFDFHPAAKIRELDKSRLTTREEARSYADELGFRVGAGEGSRILMGRVRPEMLF
jgi:hypothetical protein